MKDIAILMSEVEELFGNEVECYLAGGYLRDMENGRTPKDIDIMVTPVNDFGIDAEGFRDGIEDFELFEMKEDYTERCQYLSDMLKRGVTGLVSGEVEVGTGKMDAQFIFYGKPMTQIEITEDMDMNICQITMASNGMLIKSAAYIHGVENKVIQVLADYSEKRQLKRIRRMQEKYPEYEVM